MLIQPAVHIARFGVFPDREIAPTMRESFIATQSISHEKDLARQMPDLLRELSVDIDDDDAIALGNEQEKVSTAAALRMRNAYQMAARQGWIKPIRGDVYLAPAITLGPSVQEQLETSVLASFYDIARGLDVPAFTLTAPAQTAAPLATIAHIRCVLSGEVIPFGETGDLPYLFKTIADVASEPDLDPAWFNFTGIDTVAHCRAHTNLRLSPLMGHGGFKPPAPGRHPV